MASTYTLISSNVLSSSATSVTFSAIPSTYTDLVLRFTAALNAGGPGNLSYRLNGITATSYSETWLRAYQLPADSFRQTSQTSFIGGWVPGTNQANVFSSQEIYIPNYTSSSTNKQISNSGASEANSAANAEWYLNCGANLFVNTSAITSITLSLSSFAAGSSFYLYGIKNS